MMDANSKYYYGSYLFPRKVRGLRVLDVGGDDGTIALYLMRYRGAEVDIVDEYEGHLEGGVSGAGRHLSGLAESLEPVQS